MSPLATWSLLAVVAALLVFGALALARNSAKSEDEFERMSDEWLWRHREEER